MEMLKSEAIEEIDIKTLEDNIKIEISKSEAAEEDNIKVETLEKEVIEENKTLTPKNIENSLEVLPAALESKYLEDLARLSEEIDKERKK